MHRLMAPLRLLAATLACWGCLVLLAQPATAVSPSSPATSPATRLSPQALASDQVDQGTDPQHARRQEKAKGALFWIPVQLMLIALAGGLVLVRRSRE